MREERLLNRIRSREKDPARRSGADSKMIISSIHRHLQLVLNTRQGSVPIADDYGIPDMTDFMSSYPESLRNLEKSIRQTIQKFEPRLKGVRVSFVQDNEDLLSLSFKIIAQLALEKEKKPIIFESQIDADGKVKLKE